MVAACPFLANHAFAASIREMSDTLVDKRHDVQIVTYAISQPDIQIATRQSSSHCSVPAGDGCESRSFRLRATRDTLVHRGPRWSVRALGRALDWFVRLSMSASSLRAGDARHVEIMGGTERRTAKAE
jgi:hypothetical protein